MKWIVFSLLAFSVTAKAATMFCGIPPVPPPGMIAVCICDERMDCRWVLIERR